MFIQIEETPNPDTLKFMPGRTVMKEGTAEFKSANEAKVSFLADRLFALKGIARIFYGHDFIAVTKSSAKDWLLLKPRVLGAIMEHFSGNGPLFHKGFEENAGAGGKNASAQEDQDDEIVVQIKEVLETRVRPAVARDGGDIVFDRFENGVLYLKMQGACAGCPSSTITLKSGIENMMRHFVPEVREVSSVEN